LELDCCAKIGAKLKESDIDTNLLAPVFRRYAGVDGSLITVLQKAQELYGWLPVDLLAYIAAKMSIRPARVLGVATFYTQFRTAPAGKNLILLCQGTACHVNGSAAIETAVREELGAQEGEITADSLFTYNTVACLGCCSLSPVMMIGGETYGKLTPDKTRRILRGIREKEAAGL
jgi:NADH-quinone oxidoreductase subunit E